MSASLKISANTSEVKKSLLDLGKDVKNLGRTKVSVFSEQDRKFIKSELKQELSAMKAKLGENRAEISKLIKEQSKLEKGTKAELEHRKKILSAYQQQTRLASQMDRVQKQNKDMGGFGGSGGSGGGSGGMMGMLGKFASLAAGATLAVGALGLVRGYQANQQYATGASNRVRLRGLGGSGSNASPEELANAGMTEQDFIKRQIATTSRLGRAGGSSESIMQQARFERSFGLEEGSMMNVSGALRGSMGGRGADSTQAKLQAAILASGIEDAIGPYLDSVTELLTDINKNGITNTDEMIQLMSEITKEGKRTPEQIAEAFGGIDKAVKGSSGEANAFFQMAFARRGIGGGTIGGTRAAMSSGGIFGLNEEELSSQGYNPGLIKNMKGAGFTSGLGNRSGAILDQFKTYTGGQNIGDITDLNKKVGVTNMANSMFGTEGEGGFQALQMLEKVQNKQMTQKQFDDKLQEMRDKKDPSLDRLNKINTSLEGLVDVAKNINANLMEALGKNVAKAGVAAMNADSTVVQGTSNVAGAIDQAGVFDKGLNASQGMRSNLTSGGLGDKLYNLFNGSEQEQTAAAFREGESRIAKRGNMPSAITDPAASSSTPPAESLTDAVEKGMTKAMQAQKAAQIHNNNRVNVRIQNGDGSVTNKTHR